MTDRLDTMVAILLTCFARGIFVLILPAIALAQSSAGDLYRIAATHVPALEGGDEEILKRGERALQLFDAASELRFGDWGLVETDPTYGGRGVRGLAELGELVLLRARVRAERGDLQGALGDCHQVGLLARRLSVQPSLTRQMQQNELMARAIEMAGTLLMGLDAAQIERFTALLRELPPAADPEAIAGVEEESYLWLYTRLIEDDGIRRMARRASGTLNAMFGIQTPPIDVEDLARDPQKAQAVLDETHQVFAKMVQALNEPAEERAAAMRIIPRQYDFTHPLSRGAAELVMRSYLLHEEQMTRMDMLFAAAAILADPNRPIDAERARGVAGRFDFVLIEGGFELRWKPSADENVQVLRVGPLPRRQGPASRMS